MNRSQIIKYVFVLLVTIFGLNITFPSSTFAKDVECYGEMVSNGKSTKADDCKNTNSAAEQKVASVETGVKENSSIIIKVIGGIGCFVILIGIIKLIIAKGDAPRKKQARRIIIIGAIATTFAILAFEAIKFVLSRVLESDNLMF